MASLSFRWRSLLWISILILGAGGAATALIKTRPDPPAQPVEEQVWTVDAERIELASAAPEITLYGEVGAPRLARLTAAVTASVQERRVDAGDQVAKGELLLKLDPREARLALSAREAQIDDIRAQLQTTALDHEANEEALAIDLKLLALAEREVERIRQLEGRRVSSQSQLDQALRTYHQQNLSVAARKRDIASYPARRARLEAQLRNAETALENARLDLERTDISAPFAGRVVSVETAPGARVRNGDALLSLYQSDRLEVRALIPDKHLEAVRQALAQGEPLFAEARQGDRRLQLPLDRLAAQVEDGSAGVAGLFSVPVQDWRPEVGRTLSLNLQLPVKAKVASLPAQALYGTQRIYRVVEGRLEAIDLDWLGSRLEGGKNRLLVKAAQLRPGDRVLVTQLPNAMNGLKVEIREADSES